MANTSNWESWYFTYSMEGQPFCGGWTRVIARSCEEAIQLFRMFHPDKNKGFVNCASMYGEREFKNTRMYRDGNFGEREVETIGLFHEVKKQTEENA